MTKGKRRAKERVKTAKGRRISSTRWLQRHINDPYVAMASEEGYRSRASFKLLEIDEEMGVFKGVKKALDLGSFPGSWCQVLQKKLPKVKITAIDLQEMDPIEGVDFIKGDFLHEETQKNIEQKYNLILSDMAPSSCGDKKTDQLRSLVLAEEVFYFALENLEVNGSLVIKIFRTGQEQELNKLAKERFARCKNIKPKASYKDSSEIYLICVGYKGVL